MEIDLTRQILVLAGDGRVVRIHDVSTGAAATPTPRGRFRIERRIDGWRTSRLGTMWRLAYFVGGYAVHGCVRLVNASMNRLWPSVTVGTPVEVHR